MLIIAPLMADFQEAQGVGGKGLLEDPHSFFSWPVSAPVPARTIKVPDHPEALSFQIRGTAPPCVFAVGRGERESGVQSLLGPHRGRGEPHAQCKRL